MKKIYWLFIFLFSILKAQVKVIDLSTGRFDDGSVMPIEIEDPDWKCIRPDGSEHIARTRHTYSGWYYPQFKDNTYNERWITGAPGDPGEGYFIYKSKSFVVPKGSKANLEIRTLAFMRQWTYIVKENSNGNEEESQITQTTWMNDGAKGWFNSRNPLIEKALEPGSYHIKVKVYVNSSRARQSINVASKVYISSSNEKDYTYAPNSYIYDIEKAKKENLGGISIPVKKAYAMWENNEFLNKPIPVGKLSASIYWEDIPGLIRSAEIEGKEENAKIEVVIDKARGKGNALIAFHVGPKGNHEDPIYWSWHVWVTDDPSNGVVYSQMDSNGNHLQTDIDGNPFAPQYMDRNLGALSNHFLGHDGYKSIGLFYEWGRKDPFPSNQHGDGSFYELNGVVGPVRHKDIVAGTSAIMEVVQRKYDDINDNIKYSIHNPFTYILAPKESTRTWFSKKEFKQEGANYVTWDLWGDNTKGKDSNGGSSNVIVNKDSWSYELKSAFDPCPNGWRIPSYYGRETVSNSLSPWGRNNSGGNDDKYNDWNKDFFLNPNVNEGNSLAFISTKVNNYTLNGIKIYPYLGMDFTNAQGGKRNIGVFPITGNFEPFKTNDNLSVVYEDLGADGGIWPATYARGAKYFKINSDMTKNNKLGIHQVLATNQTADTDLGHSVRCMRDPNISKIGNFVTEYLPAKVIDYTDGLNNPNSYIISGKNIQKIPVNKAFSVNNQYLTDHELLPSDQLVANVYWTTNKKLIKRVYIEKAEDPKNSNIIVEIDPSQTGNAVISLHNGKISNPIYWSWHLWAPASEIETLTYVTEQPMDLVNKDFINMTKSTFAPLTTTFMDRNMGAIEAFPLIDVKEIANSKIIEKIKYSGGMQYQWGRKDPIPSFVYAGNQGSYEIYMGNVNPNSGSISYENISINELSYQTKYTQKYPYTTSISNDKNKYSRIRKAIKYSVENPLTFLYHPGTSSYDFVPQSNKHDIRDWVSNSVADKLERGFAEDRWGHGGKKSPFDPCPEGWRVPDVLRTTMIEFGSSIENPHLGTSPWYIGDEMQKEPLSIENTYYGTIISNLGYIFNDPRYPIGNFPHTGIRGELGNSKFSIDKRSGVWLAALSDHMIGYAWAMNFSLEKGLMRTGMGAFPQAAMNVRCAKDVPRYDGTIGKNSQPKLKKDALIESINDIKEDLSESQIQIYPNPNSGLFTIKLGNLSSGTIKIFNSNGNLIFTEPIIGEEIKVNIQNQPAGIYFIKIQSNKTIITKKIIIN